MKYIKYLFLAAIALALVLLALANRDPVTLTVLPHDLAEWVNWNVSITLPLFIVLLGGIVAGLLIGFVWEWFREHKQRAEAKANRKERDQLAREVQALKGDANRGRDEVLALLED
ncbi:lipopolysaccharide assembly protein LapA domain-containing protein [Nioella sp.]|uniref:lipopolysaccharide assembly protein LapA domain-containing protein n=1 Tax=Nioella sp. TaxID=1912091 RepID=UPI003515548C